ncbi:MAG: hypothetical protein CMP22_00510 [Rickettsiales bacterium]|nr:hypothetical protein [Rickettsiales bacterium]
MQKMNKLTANDLNFLNTPSLSSDVLEMDRKLKDSLTKAEQQSEIPVLDISLYEENPEAWSLCFVHRLAKYGFALFKNHGLDTDQIEDVYNEVRTLFNRDPKELEAYSVHANGKRGISVFGRERHYSSDNTNPDMKEYFQFGPENIPHDVMDKLGIAANLWPKEQPSFKAALLNLSQGVDRVQTIILSAIGHVFEGNGQEFVENFKYGETLWRTIHYPALDSVEDTGGERSASHTDGGFCTLLLSSNEKGLVVQPDKEKPETWIRPETGSQYMVMNVGRILDRMTKGFLPATWHKVEKPEDNGVARVSIPRFIWPNNDFSLYEFDCPAPLASNKGRDDLTNSLVQKHPVGQDIKTFRETTLSQYKDAKEHEANLKKIG